MARGVEVGITRDLLRRVDGKCWVEGVRKYKGR